MTTNTNTEEFDPTIALDFTDDPYVNEDAVILDGEDWDDWEEDRNDNDDIASAWGF